MSMAVFKLLPLILLLPITAIAQEHQHPPGQRDSPMMGMMQGMGGGMMAESPAMILRMREPLGLAPQQVQRLEEIQARTHSGHEQHMEASMRIMGEANAILESEAPDLARYEARLREAADHHVQAHAAMARGMVEAREVLTPEQRSNLRFAARMMQQMMQDHMQEMMGGRRPSHP